MRPSLAAAAVVVILAVANAQPAPPAAPTAADPRLVVERFAAAPDIVQPIALDFDARGRLLVVESHTHFRPANYAGPKADRVRVLEDTDGDGRADKFTTFFEGTTATMDLAVHPDGSVYLATRNEVLRLRDTDGDGTADEKTRVAFLDTAGNYPHNGLAGLAFDARGDLIFGMGENLGAPYKLVGADGTTLTGGGEGGNLFRCTADGKQLRRMATGFWNPFGTGRDIFGRLIVADNDPDSSPPCRLLHAVEGGDYGFQFRYGRSGRHPFQAWNGELPGTLPFAAGTGESPCEVVCYESDGLPAEYRGDLLVPAWADHRVERYTPRAKGATVVAERRPFVQGGPAFHPSGLATAPDGSLFVSDWGSKEYTLHGKGAVWHVRWKDAKPAPRPADPKLALASPHRPARDAAARTLARDEAGRSFLRGQLKAADVRTRAAALDGLIAVNDGSTDLASVARTDAEPAVRAMAVRGLVARKADVAEFAADGVGAAVRAEAVAGLTGEATVPVLLKLLADADPFLRHAAVRQLARHPDLLVRLDRHPLTEDPKVRAGLLLVWRATGHADAVRALALFLADPDPDVRFLAAKWVADERLARYRPRVVEMMADPRIDPRGLTGLATALARIDNQPIDEDGLAKYFLDRLADPAAPAALRLAALRAVPAASKRLRTDTLVGFLRDPSAALRVEALRALKDRADPAAAAAARAVAADAKAPTAVRAQALVTLAAAGAPDADFLLGLAAGGDAVLSREAIRSLSGATLTPVQRGRLEPAAAGQAEREELAARVLGKPFHAGRPPATDTAAWLKRLDGPADAEAGRRVFEHPRVAGCARCHAADGRGAGVGPDLSRIGRTDRRWVVESIVQPSAAVAPHYQAWRVETLDGRSRTGLLVGTHLDESVYVDEKGERFRVRAGDEAGITPARGSLMPDGLLDGLTDQEARDLVAYLLSRK
ncbi:PVC-type heme-binding CxxCH protein [Urbifossiella limnaea]|uniref:Cytochrome c n=1 Tax=Urbifossiella limnaea TaxID=2528023 RepID=A0A517Y287_9BACT|nr:PVC-type heme-binding CxxCH protein [Urbifossiella limnaea]QDU23881.1 Cytochrome c [Urbifossiella limnaea]